MELQTRLAFIDTSAFEEKQFQFGHYALDRLASMVEEGKIHLLITDVIRNEVESHMKKKAEASISQFKKFKKDACFLRIAENAIRGGLFLDISVEDVLEEALGRFSALIDNGQTEILSVGSVDPSLIFKDYFSGKPPFHRESKKHEFPDAFSLMAVDSVATERNHKVYIVSKDEDMKATAEKNDKFIHLSGIDDLLNLINRNDEELSQLSEFADSILNTLKGDVLSEARHQLESSEFIPCLSGDMGLAMDPEVDSIEILKIETHQLQLIDVTKEKATYDICFKVELNAIYTFTDMSHATWDREDRKYYGIEECQYKYHHEEHYNATLDIGFDDGIKANAEIVQLVFDDTYFEVDIDEATALGEVFDSYNYDPQEPEVF